MAANVLNSKQAVQMSVFVVRAFVKLRAALASNRELAIWVLIRCVPETQRHCTVEKETLSEIRKRIEKHMKDTYFEKVQSPQGVKPTPEILNGAFLPIAG
jgi:hypothetical protein